MIADAPASGLYALHAKQADAMALLGLDPSHPTATPVNELLYGGEGGGGKSLLERALMLTLATLWPGSRGALFRRTYPELEDTHLAQLPREIPPSVATYHAVSHELHFPNGSVGVFRHVAAEHDLLRYLSSEWEYLLIDEASAFTPSMLTLLRSRVRSTRPDWWPIIVYATNPGGAAHEYFLDGFVDAAEEGTVFTAPEDDGGMRRCFLRARLSDNPSLPEAEYRRRLQGISDPDLRRAISEGDWRIFGSQVFPEWRDQLHVCDPFTVPPEWPRWSGLDYGYVAPACHLWLARGPSRQAGLPPQLYVYREWYETGIPAPSQALRIKQASADGLPARVYADPSMWTKPLSGIGPSLAEVFQAEGLPLVKANNARLPGVARVHQALATHEVFPPRLQVFSTCRNLLRTLPRLRRDELHPEDVDTTLEDHAYDALRYGLMGAASGGGGGRQLEMREG